ncbi:MAG: serine hydrolase [Candidatus Promineifilaceae bacterium]|nr:serine hydrolase [Candidatus Promineifilaceae bacterium]
MDIPAVEQEVEEILHDYQVPGAAIAVVKNDALLFAMGCGLRSIDEAHPVDIHTCFGIASISKSFTTMALGMLVDEGLLSWSDPVTKFLPDFQMQSAYVTREVTVRDLLIHRSGLPEVAGGTLWYGSRLSRKQVIAGMRHLRPASSFRSQYAYQNITYLAAGQIIPAVCGRSWDDFIQERIFAPLGMNSSNTSIHAYGGNDNIAQPHVEIEGRWTRVPLRDYDNVGPAASINTTAVDLAAYTRLLLNGGRFKDQQLYSSQIAADLWTPHSLIPIEARSPASLKYFLPRFHNTYALGWVIQDVPERAQIKVSHSGGIDGLRSLLTLIPGENLGIIALANNESPAPLFLTQRLLDRYWNVSNGDWYREALQKYIHLREQQVESAQSQPVPGTSPSLSIANYAGTFTSTLIGEIEITTSNGQLTLQFPHSPSLQAKLSHWHYDTFRLTWVDPVVPDGFVTFVLNAAGQIEEIRLNQPNLLDVDFSEIHPIIKNIT